MKKPALFIVLNILISAVTTSLVLLIWDAAHKAAEPQSSGLGSPTQPIQLSECVGTLPLEDENLLEVKNVTGVGDLSKEEVTLVFTGQEAACLNGWKIRAKSNLQFDFPGFYQLFTEGVQIKIRSRAGEDSALELYWNQQEPVWKSGDTIKLIDPSGNVHFAYEIP